MLWIRIQFKSFSNNFDNKKLRKKGLTDNNIFNSVVDPDPHGSGTFPWIRQKIKEHGKKKLFLILGLRILDWLYLLYSSMKKKMADSFSSF